MAQIPQVPTSMRRIGVLPQVQMYRSRWGEAGREVNTVLDTGLRTLGQYQGMRDAQRRSDYILAKRAEADAERERQAQEREQEKARIAAERAAEIERRRVDREGRYRAAQFVDFVRSGWSGTVKFNPDGSSSLVPGVVSKNWHEQDAEKKDSAAYMGDLIAQAKKQDFYTTATSEERAAMERALQPHLREFGRAAMLFHAQTNEARIKEQNAYREAKWNEELQSVEGADQQVFAAKSNIVALRKVAQHWGSDIANPEILDEGLVRDGDTARTVTLRDLRIKGAKDDDPRYAQMEQDYRALVKEHAKNRITNLTRLAARDTGIGAMSPDELLQECEQTVESMDRYGLVSDNERAALELLLSDAEEKMVAEHGRKQAAFAAEVNDELSGLQYRIAPTMGADGKLDTTNTFAPQSVSVGDASVAFGDEEAFKKALDAQVNGGAITPAHAEKLFSRFQQLHRWQLSIRDALDEKRNAELGLGSGGRGSGGMTEAQAQKAAEQQQQQQRELALSESDPVSERDESKNAPAERPVEQTVDFDGVKKVLRGLRYYPVKSNPNTYVRLRLEILNADDNGTNIWTLMQNIENARDRGLISPNDYLSLASEISKKRGAAEKRALRAVFTAFLGISESAFDKATDPSLRGTKKGDDAVSELLGSSSAEYFTTDTWFHNPDFTISDVDDAVAFISDYIRANPNSWDKAQLILEQFVKPKSEAAAARTFAERLRKARERGVWSVNEAYRAEDEENARKQKAAEERSRETQRKIIDFQSRRWQYGGGGMW